MNESAPAPTAGPASGRLATLARRGHALVMDKVIDNPLLNIELRRWMRGSRPFLAVTVYLLLMLLPLLTIGSRGGNPVMGRLGRGGELCLILFGCQCAAICLFAPALTASALPREHARGTYNDLRLSLLTASEIIIGKFMLAQAVVLLLLVLSLPYYTLGFMLGGVSPMLILHDQISLVLLAGSLAAFALLAGALTEKTASAIALTYILLLMFFSQIGCLFLFVSQGLARGVNPLPAMFFDIITLVPVIIFLLALARARICEEHNGGVYVAYATLLMVGIWTLVFALALAAVIAAVALKALGIMLPAGMHPGSWW